MKKILAMVLSLALVATMAITGSIAYLQDSDEAVNVMTLGNVEIDQIEQEWNEDYTALQDFTQEKPLYPYVGENNGWENESEKDGAYRRFANMNNVVDKYVSVKNTGKSDAYVRTIFAFEMGDYTYDEFKMIRASINSANGNEFQFPGTWKWTDNYATTIDGKAYNIMVAVHEDAIEPGETTIPSLLQVYMTKESTNETCEKLDGNDNGTYDILVISQAVQSMGFDDAQTALDTAFGDVDADNVQTWFSGLPTTNVATADEFEAALNDATKGQTIKPTTKIEGTIKITGELEDVVIDMSAAGEDANIKFNIADNAKVKNVTITGLDATIESNSGSYNDGGIIDIDAKAVVDNLVIEDSDLSGSGERSCIVGIAPGGASEITIRNCVTDGTKYLVYSSGNTVSKLTIEDCKINNHFSWVVQLNAGNPVGAQMTINNCEFENCSGGIAKTRENVVDDTVFTFTNNTVTNSTGHDGYAAKWFEIGGETVVVSGNTLDGANWTPGSEHGLKTA